MAESTARKRKPKETVSNVQPMPSTRTRKTKPLSTPEGRETQLINKAINQYNIQREKRRSQEGSV